MGHNVVAPANPSPSWASPGQRDRAARPPATLRSAGTVAGIDTGDWMHEAPELPEIRPRMAMLSPYDPADFG
ncbi:hypothetical protein [Streptomyces sp. A5-4]|uniref:hypothetical protein n=1 Tax=Streptomyces sp. A5-4 TaxID=3384771 RepID=UPI003DA7AC4A